MHLVHISPEASSTSVPGSAVWELLVDRPALLNPLGPPSA